MWLLVTPTARTRANWGVRRSSNQSLAAFPGKGRAGIQIQDYLACLPLSGSNGSRETPRITGINQALAVSQALGEASCMHNRASSPHSWEVTALTGPDLQRRIREVKWPAQGAQTGRALPPAACVLGRHLFPVHVGLLDLRVGASV